MIPAQASRTALRVALHRAAHQLLDAPTVFVDPLALRILGPKVEAAFRADPAQYDTSRFAPQMRAFMAVRARFAEEQIAQARAAGVRQVVILGAGLDTYAYRSPAAPSVTIWEVDHPATQAWKHELLAAAGIEPPPHLKFVAADLAREPLEGVLAAGGITFDYSIAPHLLAPAERWAYEALAARVSAVGEPWLSHFVPAELVTALANSGLAVARDLDPQELLQRFVADGAERPRLGRLARLMWAGAAPYTA